MKSFHAVVSNLSLKKLCRVNDSGLSVTHFLAVLVWFSSREMQQVSEERGAQGAGKDREGGGG